MMMISARQVVRSPSLLLVCLLVREGEPTRPLVRARLPADAPIGTSKQDAPERNGAEEATANGAERVARDARLGPEGIAVEGAGGVEEGRYGERREGVGRLGVRGIGSCSCADRQRLFESLRLEAEGGNTFSEATGEGHRAREQDVQSADGQEGEAEAAREVDFEGCMACQHVVLVETDLMVQTYCLPRALRATKAPQSSSATQSEGRLAALCTSSVLIHRQ
jgi:hypothetical protein